jgi:ATP-dependent protease Clp ATPase subunit
METVIEGLLIDYNSLYIYVTDTNILMIIYEEFEDTNVVIRTRTSKKNRQHKDRKIKDKSDKQRSIKHTQTCVPYIRC